MKTINYLIALILSCLSANAQTLKYTSPGDNRKAMIYEMIGITDVTIQYTRPGVKGREGQIYGTPVVHAGFIDLGWGTTKTAPWRAGANENTIIEFSTDVKIEGKPLPAGKYGFHIAYFPEESILIFSKNYTSWGSAYYDEKEDALRVKIKPVALERSVEWLKYEFMYQTGNAATIALQWEKLMFPFRVEVDLVQTQLQNYRDGLRGLEGLFDWKPYVTAASLCELNNVNLEEGLTWSNTAVSMEKNFSTLSTNALLLIKLGKGQKADSIMKEAFAIGTMQDIHGYGRDMLSRGKKTEALEVFKRNAEKYPNQYTTYVGLARGYSANGNYKEALTNAKFALPMAPDKINKDSVEAMLKKLDKGQDIN
jgi:tetratricopeptide (TPR) repeat protein